MACGWMDLSRPRAPITMPTQYLIASKSQADDRTATGKRSRRRLWLFLSWILALATVLVVSAVWLTAKAKVIRGELNSAIELVGQLEGEVSRDDIAAASATVERIRNHTSTAEHAADDPAWAFASSIPFIGNNFVAVAEVARSADDVASLGLVPLITALDSLDWQNLLPSTSGTNLEPLKAAAPSVSSAANAVRLSADRLAAIDSSNLIPQVAEPLSEARLQLEGVVHTLDAAAAASKIAPGMLGADSPRSYLLMVQNNAEVRATGGIVGALAVVTLDKGRLSLGAQSSAGEVGVTSPPIPIDAEQLQIYTGRVGKFLQDVNLTPDFPTSAVTAQAMWERKTGQRVDGVISIDPVALGYILDSTGPIEITNQDLVMLAKGGLPTQLTGENVVQTLLSDVYAKIEQPNLQDAYFAGVAQAVFSALSDGQGDPKTLLQGITRGSNEGRVHVWSGSRSEQETLAKYALSGAVVGPSVRPAEFGVFFNDGTGAKMDYYVRRSVRLVKNCPRDGYEETTVRIISTNTAPANAASSLPAYVTGGGGYGVPPGSVQTNITAYGPVQAVVETAHLDGQKVGFAPYLHSNRPVGVVAVQLAPGESKTVEFTFARIVQHTEPNLVVTPTVQSVKDVVLPTENANCS